MFTGIIEEVGKVREARDGFLRVEAPKLATDARPGDSIAIDGVDLTVVQISENVLSFQVMAETYRHSCLARLREEDRVNLEGSVRPSDRLSGHIVRGVVEGTGTLVATRRCGDAEIATYRAPRELLEHVVVKGPICVDGVSLTVVDKVDELFSVSLVRYTREHTTHPHKEPGDPVNLETDILARYVAAIMEARGAVPPAPA